ncbi:daf-1 [Pristionchus pacificus]|uniref:receptor protein serine/threonine kinase n=1 Tax=Pristionchus pacificus TaxID=54126 RepID=A0A2A6CC20_PRIPA|nr:daf-1 [Pristionchus pacificus]|eukprot:PDM75647.1 daf-1 [Pristionchus pacificus]
MFTHNVFHSIPREFIHSIRGMRRLLIPLLLFFVFSSEGKPFDDDENLFANLNKTLLEISQTPVKELTLDELSAAMGKHIPPEHRDAAEELLQYRDDRPIGALMSNLQTYGTYTKEMAEEFSRGAMRALLDKSYMLPSSKKLGPGDHLCRCNQRQCATISNELYAIFGPEMASFCRVDKYGFCMQSTTRTANNTNQLDLYCAYSYATDHQKSVHDTNEHTHRHNCESTKTEGKKCCKGSMCNDVPLPTMDPLETTMEAQIRELSESVSTWKVVSSLLGVLNVILALAFAFVVALLCKFDLEELKKKLAAVLSIHATKPDDSTCKTHSRYFNHDAADRASTTNSETPLIHSTMGDTTFSMGSNRTKMTFVEETTVGLQSGIGGTQVAQKSLSAFVRPIGQLGQIQPGQNQLGQGTFGRVFLAVWRGGEKIAVKKFNHNLKDSFEQEVEILKSGMMSNSNIIRWVGEDTFYSGNDLEHWILMEYHANGSLYDYMQKNTASPTFSKHIHFLITLSESTLLNMIRGIANGVSFLHSEFEWIKGKNGKNIMAHRDLKTKNILVKSDLTCVIADFGMAVINKEDGVKLPTGKIQSGTVRYLSPEVLTNTIKNDIEHYKMSDMYSFGLIVWECTRRTDAVVQNVWKPAHSMEESLAYYDCVPREPTQEDMIDAVVSKGFRPKFHDYWKHNLVFWCMERLIVECWQTDPTTRISAFNVKGTIDKVATEYNIKLPTD